MGQKRKSNIELLRIIAMLLIISFHYVFKSEYVFEQLNYNSFIVKTFYFFGELGVNLFFLITGYFLIKGKFSMKKFIKLILEVNFYYIITLIVYDIVENGTVNLLETFKIYILELPTIFNKYWFITVYILLYVLSPYLNMFLQSLKKSDYQKLLMLLILIWSIIPTIFGIRLNDTEKLLYYNRFIWAIIIYFIGAYMRLYTIKFFEKNGKLKATVTAIVSFAIMVLGILVIYKFRDVFSKIGTKEVSYFWRPNTIPMLLLSISIFKIFLDIKLNYNKIINKLASTTLGIYLLHDGKLTPYIFNDIFKVNECLNSNYSILYIIEATFIIFIVGAIIDIIRQFLEKYTVNKILDSHVVEKMTKKTNEMVKKFFPTFYDENEKI